MTKYIQFRKGELLEVRNYNGTLISWGSFESEDKDFTVLRQIIPASGKPYWAFEIGRFPKTQFAFIRQPGKRGDMKLFDRAVRESVEILGNNARADSGIFMLRSPDPQKNFEHRLFGTRFKYQAVVDLELNRIKAKGWNLLKFSFRYEDEAYEALHRSAMDRLLMDPAADSELVIARIVRGRWNIQTREYFLDVLERMGSPHLNLLREVLGAKKLKNEGRPKPVPFIGL
ncbi:hypothetical protein IT407_00945 [Candidatus Uhrbacteria bacterium]|nr:hypothetical protein [Candidatus Uhrbacteria bacterium]